MMQQHNKQRLRLGGVVNGIIRQILRAGNPSWVLAIFETISFPPGSLLGDSLGVPYFGARASLSLNPHFPKI
jgi:hypothetical protein